MIDADGTDRAVKAVKQEIAEVQNAARSMAKTFMRRGQSRWIEISLREGWGYNLEELARSAAYQHWVKTRALPSLALMDCGRITEDDHKYFKRHGRQLNDVELTEVRAARATVSETSKRMTGEQ
jgi:hypothetical protein